LGVRIGGQPSTHANANSWTFGCGRSCLGPVVVTPRAVDYVALMIYRVPSTVAGRYRAVSGFGACPPDDCGGVTGYAIKVAELLGLRAMDGGVKGNRNDDDYDSDLEALPEGETNRHADPIAVRLGPVSCGALGICTQARLRI